MPTVFGSVDVTYLPAQPNPQTTQGDQVAPPVAGALTSNSMPSDPARFAGLTGTLTINNISMTLDTTTLTGQNICDMISASPNPVTAALSPTGKIKMTTAAGISIVVAGTAAMLQALGLVAGTTLV